MMSYKFGITGATPCSYIDGNDSKNIVLMPDESVDQWVASELNLNGFRRSGTGIYRPHCDTCNACQSLRLPVDDFDTKRRHRRTQKANEALRVVIADQFIASSYYPLYERYISERHKDGDMYPPQYDVFVDFLGQHYPFTKYLELYDDEQLIGVMVFDQLIDGLSAVYSFFDPDPRYRSLGQLLILKLIDLAKAQTMPFCYLGYYVEGAKKMAYKADYSPSERFNGLNWV